MENKRTRETQLNQMQGRELPGSLFYALIYVILRNKRYTLSVKYIRKGESSKAVEHGAFGQSKSKILKDTIDFILEEVEQTGFKIKGLYLDRKFFTVEVINYLQEKQLPFIMPVF